MPQLSSETWDGVPGWTDPGAWTLPLSSTDPGQRHILEGHNDDKDQQDQALIKQGHYVAARFTDEGKAPQKASQMTAKTEAGLATLRSMCRAGWGQNKPWRLEVAWGARVGRRCCRAWFSLG